MRPSKLPMAARCPYSAKLSEQFPEQSEAAGEGTAIHDEIAWAIQHGRETKDPRAKGAVEWHRRAHGGLSDVTVLVEAKVTLRNATAKELTTGTVDLAYVEGAAEHVTVVDWKTGRPENVDPAKYNLQLQAYALGLAQITWCKSFQTVIVFISPTGECSADWGPLVKEDAFPNVLRRIQAVIDAPAVPTPGDHCMTCYSRMACYSWRDRASLAIQAMGSDKVLTERKPDGTGEMAITDDDASRLYLNMQCAKELVDAADRVIKAHVMNGGKCVVNGKHWAQSECAGRTGWDAAAMEEDGIADKYRKPGKPFMRWAWLRV